MVELLAPAGSIEAFYAAIENGADAVYLGGKHFNARAYANNFDNDTIKELIKYAHLFSVKVYVTINTIIFDEEIEELIEFLDFLYLNDCDAVIVSDLGVLNIIRNRYPDFEIHASTQMNIQSIEEVLVLKQLGVKRIVVAREINLDEIKKFIETNIEIEVFVHGALCVSCSGNCYISSIIGKRSGNRGRCAQACRLPYSIKEESGYLISPKDLYTLPNIKELIESKIKSFKIEGRMKRPEYVALLVKTYRKAIDNYYNNSSFDINAQEIEIKKIFNRGFTKGFLFNEEDQNFINKVASNHQGILIGKVIYSNNNNIKVKLSYPINKGDSFRIIGGDTDAITVNQMYLGNKLITEAKIGDIISLRSHIDGLTDGLVYLTTASKQIEGLEKSYKELTKKISIDCKIDLVDDYLRVILKYQDKIYQKLTEVKVEKPLNQSSNSRILEQFQKIKDTVFEYNSFIIDIDKPIFISIKIINDLRREALDEFRELLWKKHQNRKILQLNLYPTNIEEIKAKTIIKVRTLAQLEAALDFDLDEIYITNLDLYEKAKNSNKVAVFYHKPRVNIRNDEDICPSVKSTLSIYKDSRTSVYMNVANAYSVNLLEYLGAKSIGLSIELSKDQIQSLVYNYKKLFSKAPNLEMNVYGRYELMMIKYQLGLKPMQLDGSVNLVDRKNYGFPLLLEDNYVKILNSKKLHLIDYIDKLKSLNISPIIDFTIENADEVRDVLEIYLKNANKKLYDVTSGHINEGVL